MQFTQRGKEYFEYRLNKDNEVVANTIERYQRSIEPELIDESPSTIYIVDQEVIEKYFGIITILKNETVVLHSDIIELNEQALGYVRSNANTYNVYYDSFCNDIGCEDEADGRLENSEEELNDNSLSSGKRLKIPGESKYLKVARKFAVRFLTKNIEVLTVASLTSHQNRLISDLPLNPIKPIEIEPETVEFYTGVLIINTFNNSTGWFVCPEKRIAVKNIKTYMQSDKLRLPKFILDEKTADDDLIDESEFLSCNTLKTRIVAGSVKSSIPEGDHFLLEIIPINRRFGTFHFRTNNPSFYLNKKILCLIHNYEEIEVLKVLGESCDYEVEVNTILEHFGVDYKEKVLTYDEKPEEMNSSVKVGKNESIFDKIMSSISKTDPEHVPALCVDLTEKFICSIDPPGCVDIDDALHAQHFEDYIEIGVHIADVTHYIKEDDPLDLEARDRATTVYLSDFRIDMIPQCLSTQICSLRENKVSRTFSVVFKVDKKSFEVIDVLYFKSLIKNKRAFTYAEAAAALNGTEIASLNSNSVEEGLSSLVALKLFTIHLRACRFKKGALELNNPNEVDDEDVTHNLVEEMMLLTNIAVAKHIYRFNTSYSLLRKHPMPKNIKIDGFDTDDLQTGHDINKFLSENSSISYLRALMTRNLQQAFYFPSGQETDYSHFGIAAEIYTHFTSPIRRYADIIVHRTLDTIVRYEYTQSVYEAKKSTKEYESLFNDQRADKIAFMDEIDGHINIVNEKVCNRINMRNRNAKYASFASNELSVAYKMLKKSSKFGPAPSEPEMSLRGVIISKEGVVYIEEYKVEGRLSHPGDFKLFDEVDVVFDCDYEDYCITREFKFKVVK